MSKEVHRLRAKVYLEDTDAQGIVYHANYLKYCERSRTEVLGLSGYTLGEMQARGYLFVVYEMHLRFYAARPACTMSWKSSRAPSAARTIAWSFVIRCSS